MLLPTFIISAALAGNPGNWVIFVDANLATGANDGTSWVNAFRGSLALQYALQSIPSGESKQIWIADGTYYPGPAGSRSSTTFDIPAGVGLFGGFAGGEDDIWARDPAANIAILTGDLPGGTPGQPELESIVTITNGGWDTQLDGLVLDVSISGTPPNSLPNPRRALTVNGGEPSIDNCIIRDGLALCAWRALIVGAEGSFFNTTFSDNVAQQAGGGIFVDGLSDAWFNSCTFVNNGGGLGAGVYAGPYGADPDSQSDTAFGFCSFIDNHDVFGNSCGGAFFNRHGDAEFEQCSFRHCTANGGGGAIYGMMSDTWLYRCTFTDCAALGGGGALYSDNDSADPPMWVSGIEAGNCKFTGNNGAAFAHSGAEITLSDCTVANGRPQFGSSFSFPTFAATDGGLIKVRNTIAWGNAFIAGTPAGGNVQSLSGSTIELDYCNVQYWTGPSSGIVANAMLSADPKFVDAVGADGLIGTLDDDLHLKASSPCLDAANSDLLPPWMPADLEGMNRANDLPVADTGAGLTPYVDIGCYERYIVVCFEDLTEDGVVDASDLAQLLGAWGSIAPDEDLDGDQVITGADVAILLGAWGECN